MFYVRFVWIFKLYKKKKTILLLKSVIQLLITTTEVTNKGVLDNFPIWISHVGHVHTWAKTRLCVYVTVHTHTHTLSYTQIIVHVSSCSNFQIYPYLSNNQRIHQY